MKNDCPYYGFYQRNYFCDLCRKIEPVVYNECLKETKTRILSGDITKKQIENLNKKYNNKKEGI